jgi:hypothetical protein
LKKAPKARESRLQKEGRLVGWLMFLFTLLSVLSGP